MLRPGRMLEVAMSVVGDGDAKDSHNVCEQPVQVREDLRIPRCMAMIGPEKSSAASSCMAGRVGVRHVPASVQRPSRKPGR